MPKKIPLIINANSKGADKKTRSQLQRQMPRDLVEIIETATLQEARECYREIMKTGYDIISVFGGDGSCITALNLMLEYAEEKLKYAEKNATTSPYKLPNILVVRAGTGEIIARLVGAKPGINQLKKVITDPTSLKIKELPLLEARLGN